MVIVVTLNQVFGLFPHGCLVVSPPECFVGEGFPGDVSSTHALMNFDQYVVLLSCNETLL